MFGIIPARAGFTGSMPWAWTGTTDHPRSRGVYGFVYSSLKTAGGSSPLARGLRDRKFMPRRESGIIPARAGFTSWSTSSPAWPRDHPRSRGVYLVSDEGQVHVAGSSPLARGLPAPGSTRGPSLGIIPARAGFTTHPFPGAFPARDHPRSRGVYRSSATQASQRCGSSPLARGLPLRVRARARVFRIIPARAGFTHVRLVLTRFVADHPRSRGVYS